VGLQQVILATPSTACSSPVLEPGSYLNCTVSKPALQSDFEQGSMLLSVLAQATPRFAGSQSNINGSAQATVLLVQSTKVDVQAYSDPVSVAQAGVWRSHDLCNSLVDVGSL
jgi:hypothetical protein